MKLRRRPEVSGMIYAIQFLNKNDMQERWCDSIGSAEEMQAKVLRS